MTKQCLFCCPLSCPSLSNQSSVEHTSTFFRNPETPPKTEIPDNWALQVRKKPTSKDFCKPQHIRHVIFSKYQASPNTLGNFIAVIPASPSLWSMIVEFGAEMLQIIVSPHSLTRYPQMCWQHHAWLYWHRAWTISCETLVFWRVILHLDEFVERGQSVAHNPLRQCSSGDRKHGTVTAAPWPRSCPASHSTSPCLLSPSSAHTGLCTEKSHPKCLPDCQLTWEHSTLFIPAVLSSIVLLYRSQSIKTLF